VEEKGEKKVGKKPAFGGKDGATNEQEKLYGETRKRGMTRERAKKRGEFTPSEDQHLLDKTLLREHFEEAYPFGSERDESGGKSGQRSRKT